jgi:FMN-dependent NADH-azoreductase
LRILDEFTEAFKTKHPDIPIITRSTYEIPHLSYDEHEAGRANPQSHTPEVAEHYKLAAELTQEVLNAKHIVIATPMYNWSMPSSLKAWIDRILNTETFPANPKFSETPITCIIASGGPYSEEAAILNNILDNPKKDHLRPYIKSVFNILGTSDLQFINLDPTGPIDRGLMKETDEKSGLLRARGQLLSAAERIKA